MPADFGYVRLVTRQRRRVSLLGSYPRPALHLVGAPRPADPRSPGQWQPGPPPLQYGIDYTFARRHGCVPVRWPAGPGITIRVAGTGRDASGSLLTAALVTVVGELRTLTASDLVIGDPATAALDPEAVPDGEIHVGYLPDRAVRTLSGTGGGRAGLGGARPDASDTCYAAGFAALNADLAGPDAPDGRSLAVLRHELAHALGLGHATRRGLLMNYQIPAGTTTFGRGDRHGLALLARPWPPPAHRTQPARRLRMLPPCAVFSC